MEDCQKNNFFILSDTYSIPYPNPDQAKPIVMKTVTYETFFLMLYLSFIVLNLDKKIQKIEITKV